MLLPDEFTSFWSATVNPKSQCHVAVPEGTTCFLTNSSVDQEFQDRPDSGRVTLFAKVNEGGDVAITPFILNYFESTNLQLEFQEGSEIIFWISGVEIPIHICGYLTGDFVVNITETPLPDNPTAQIPA